MADTSRQLDANVAKKVKMGQFRGFGEKWKKLKSFVDGVFGGKRLFLYENGLCVEDCFSFGINVWLYKSILTRNSSEFLMFQSSLLAVKLNDIIKSTIHFLLTCKIFYYSKNSLNEFFS